MVRATVSVLVNNKPFRGTVYGVIGTVYGQHLFFHTIDATYRLKVIEEHDVDPETGEVASWGLYEVGNKAILYIEISGVKYEVLSRAERRI